MIFQLILLLVVTFLVMLAVLWLFFSRHLNTAMNRLNQVNEETQTRETYVKQELARVEQEREAAIAQGKEEAQRLVEQAKRSGEIIRRNLEDQGKIEAEKYLAQGKEELVQLKRSLFEANQSYVVGLAVSLVKYTLTEQVRETIHHALVDEVIVAIGQVEKEKFSVKTGPVAVITACALTEAQRQSLRSALAAKLDQENFNLEERIDPDILGGLSVTMGIFMVDGSLKNRLQRALETVNPGMKANV